MIRRITFPLSSLSDFDEIVDVRAPLEFAEDSMTGAINLPVLDDGEREHVGHVYKQVSAFDARKLGAAMVSRNIARHVEEHFSVKPKEYHSLVYCWRGGQRSSSLATVLSDIGWQVSLIDGGYRAYRRHVTEVVRDAASRFTFLVLNGFTGAGKTLVLQEIEEAGGQVLDLEGLASHKGSVFGGDPNTPQPLQKRFESRIYDNILRFDERRPVFVEAESAKIGRLNLPNPLWQTMKTSSVIEIDSPLEARARYLTGDYQEWLGDLERVRRTLDRLVGVQSCEVVAQWKGMAERGEWFELIESLLAGHYDRRYHQGSKSHFREPSRRVELLRHDPVSVRDCAHAVMAEAASLVDGETVVAG